MGPLLSDGLKSSRKRLLPPRARSSRGSPGSNASAQFFSEKSSFSFNLQRPLPSTQICIYWGGIWIPRQPSWPQNLSSPWSLPGMNSCPHPQKGAPCQECLTLQYHPADPDLLSLPHQITRHVQIGFNSTDGHCLGSGCKPCT